MTKETPSVGRTFGISDSLMNARPKGYDKKEPEKVEEDKVEEKVEETTEAYIRPGKAQRDRAIARKSDTLKSKDSVASTSTTRFKQRHAGDTVPTRKGTQGMARGTGVGKGATAAKRPVGGMGAVHYDLTNKPEDDFRRKYGKSKSAMRTGLRKEEQEMKISDYKYNAKDWAESLSRVGKPKEELIEMGITVQMNPGGTTYKVLSVSKDIGSRIKVGENLTDTHIDDLRDSDVSISYKGGKDGKTMKKMESVDLDTKNAEKAIKHDCATHVVHKEHGEGQCVPGMHTLEETSEGEGYVTHYDVMFRHGIEENVSVKDLEIVKEMSHGHAKKKSVKSGYMMSSKKMKESVDLDAKNVEIMLRHDCASHVKHGEFGEGVCVPGEHTLEQISEGEGIVTHYDVMFEDHGVKEDIPVYELEIITESSHMHSSKMKKKKPIMGSKKLDAVDPKELKGKHSDREDGDIDNDGDTDSSDEYLHKRRKAIKKNMKNEGLAGMAAKAAGAAAGSAVGGAIANKMNERKKKKSIKEWVSMGKGKLDESTPKDAMHAHTIAKHYYQMALRDDMFGKKAQFDENMGLSKKFFSIYKKLEAEGDTSAKNVYKDGSEDQIANFQKSEISQTNEDNYQATMKGHMKDQDKKDKAAGMIKMRKTDADGVHGTTVNQKDTDKIKALKAKGYTHVSEDYKAVEYEGEIIYEKEVWDKPMPDSKKKGSLTPAQKSRAKARAKAAGRPYPNMVDNMAVSREELDFTPDNYNFNKSSWENALAEVNRYKTGGTGHRVTQPDKSGDEHIVMQLRKAVSVGANHSGVKFKDGSVHKVNPKTAQKHLDHYNKLKPEEKIKWQNSAAHSHAGLSAASTEKKMGQVKPAASKGRDEPTRRLINPMDRD